MAVTEQERGMMENLRVQGYSATQIGGVVKELRRRARLAQAQTESDKKYAEEKAKIEAERKKAKEEEATNQAYTFDWSAGTVESGTKEEVAPIGILAPEVEKTARKKC